jgi:hypothetical protein
MIDVGKSRIALNMIGFGLICGIGIPLVLMVTFGGGGRASSAGYAVAGLVAAAVILSAVLYCLGRCIGGIVFGIAEVVRGVNSSRPQVSVGAQNPTTNMHENTRAHEHK